MYGEAGTEGACVFRIESERRNGVPKYVCGRYEEITKQPGAFYYPAFGAGCGSALCNTYRERVIAECGAVP